MIYIRNDDVLNVHSSFKKDPFKQFSKIHRWLILESPENFLHVPSIIVKDIQDSPECVEYVKSETKEGRMRPELHGYEHIDYGNLSKEEIEEHLEKSLDWFAKELEVIPEIWYTPWGSNSSLLRECAQEFNLQLVDTSQIIEPGPFLRKIARDGPDYDNDYELFIHWWERGLQLRRIVAVYRYGSIEEARKLDENQSVWK